MIIRVAAPGQVVEASARPPSPLDFVWQPYRVRSRHQRLLAPVHPRDDSIRVAGAEVWLGDLLVARGVGGVRERMLVVGWQDDGAGGSVVWVERGLDGTPRARVDRTRRLMLLGSTRTGGRG